MVVRVSEQIFRQNNATYINKFWEGAMYVAPIYGVMPGGQDATDKLQDLIDRAISEDRKSIFFPSGEYYVTSLTNVDQVVFFGDNASFIGGLNENIPQFGYMTTNMNIDGGNFTDFYISPDYDAGEF